MPPKANKWERRPRWSSALTDALAPVSQARRSMSAPRERVSTITAQERRELFARLLWLDDYRPLFRLEGVGHEPLLAQLQRDYISDHTRRLIASGSEAGQLVASQRASRLIDTVGCMQRSRNRLDIPLSQAAKGIAFLCGRVKAPIWNAERSRQRVVGRDFVIELLDEMVTCRPPPPFEVQNSQILASIAFDQTYAKAGGTTGISAYNAVQTVDAHGNRAQRTHGKPQRSLVLRAHGVCGARAQRVGQ